MGASASSVRARTLWRLALFDTIGLHLPWGSSAQDIASRRKNQQSHQQSKVGGGEPSGLDFRYLGLEAGLRFGVRNDEPFGGQRV
jgi:hypothetical protein